MFFTKKDSKQGCFAAHAGCLGPWFARIGFGLFFAAFGVQHYLNFSGEQGFRAMAMMPFALDPALRLSGFAAVLGVMAGVLAYIVPALQIAGGVLFAIKQCLRTAKFCILTSLGGILGWSALIIMLNPAQEQTGMAVEAGMNVLLFLVAYHIIKKMSCCGCGTIGAVASGCGCCGPKK